MQNDPEFSCGEPSPNMTAFLKRIESADPNDDSIDDDEKGVSWGHYQFTAGNMQYSTVITSWKAVGNTKIACWLIAAAVRTSMVAKYICKKQRLPTTALLSNIYVDNETVIFPFTKTPPTPNFKLLLANHRAPLSRRLINNTRQHPSAIHISPLPSITSQKASTVIPNCHGGTIVPQLSLSVNARVTPTLSGILQNTVIVS